MPYTYAPEVKLLTERDIKEIITRETVHSVMKQMIDRLEKAFFEYQSDKTIVPIRSGFNYSKPYEGLIEWMPVYKHNQEVLIKVVGYHPENPDQFQLPTISATISSYNTHTGHLQGLMDGVLATAIRTGAASALASKFLAKPESKVLGLIGCGAQSVTQFHALSLIFDFDEVYFYDCSAAAHHTFIQRVQNLHRDIHLKKSTIEEIVNKSDIISTATSIGISEGPLFEGFKHKSHLHINAVGSDFPGKVEIPLQLLNQALVVPDFREQAMKEGECQQLHPDQIGEDLHSIIKQKKSYQQHKSRLTVFDSTGWALEDLVSFNFFMELADKYRLGQKIAIEYRPADAINPYEFLQVEKLVAL